MSEESDWNHPVFQEYRIKLEEEDNFLENPNIGIEEGIIECIKCKSKRTYSYQKQVRSSDEGFTLFVTCANCNASWREN
jgi:DNA-directed RNA polymerase subunit M/transcription elongation factor TFIIS